MLAQSSADLSDLAAAVRAAPLVGLDTEFSGPLIRGRQGNYVDVWAPSTRLVGLSISLGLDRQWYVPVGHRVGQNAARADVEALLRALAERPCVLHNASADLRMLGRWLGQPWTPAELHDTILIGWLLEKRVSRQDGYRLKALARVYLGVSEPLTFEDLLARHGASGVDELAPADVVQYACADARHTLALHRLWWPELAAEPALLSDYRTVEIPVRGILARMEDRGALIDMDLVRLAGEPVYRLGAELAWECTVRTGLAPTQHEKLGTLLFGNGTFQIDGAPRTDTGRPSLGREALEYQLEVLPEGSEGHALAQLLRTFEGQQKLRSTYLPRITAYAERYPDGRLRDTYAQHRTDTGRLASASPILTMPVRNPQLSWLRRVVVAPPGHKLIVADYSNLELRILAHLSRSKVLIDAFHAGADPHQAVADMLGIGRYTAKTLQYAALYGAGVGRVASLLSLDTETARATLEDYWVRMSDIKRYIDNAKAFAHRNGYCRTWLGRRRALPDLTHRCNRGCPLNQWGHHRCGRRAYAERIAVNTPIQGTAADIIKTAMIAWDRDHPAQAELIAQVHDELMVEAPDPTVEAARVALETAMRGVGQWRVPLAVDAHVGNNWAEAKG